MNTALNVGVLVSALQAIAEQGRASQINSLAYAMALRAQQALIAAQYPTGVAAQPMRVDHFYTRRSGSQTWLHRDFDETHGQPAGYQYREGYLQREAKNLIDHWNEQGKPNEYKPIGWEYTLYPAKGSIISRSVVSRS